MNRWDSCFRRRGEVRVKVGGDKADSGGFAEDSQQMLMKRVVAAVSVKQLGARARLYENTCPFKTPQIAVKHLFMR